MSIQKMARGCVALWRLNEPGWGPGTADEFDQRGQVREWLRWRYWLYEDGCTLHEAITTVGAFERTAIEAYVCGWRNDERSPSLSAALNEHFFYRFTHRRLVGIACAGEDRRQTAERRRSILPRHLLPLERAEKKHHPDLMAALAQTQEEGAA